MRVSWIAALCLLVCASALPARPYEIEDLLALESYGQILIDPGERWAVIEHRSARTSAHRFDFGRATDWLTARLNVIDLDAPGAPTRLFPQEDGAGYWSGGFSPSGRSMAVFRLHDRLSLGVLDMATRDVRWLPVAPELPVPDQRPIWLDEDRLIYVGRPAGTMPTTTGSDRVQRELTVGFARARAGDVPSLSLYGAGAYRDIAIDNSANSVTLADLRTGTVETLLTGSVADIALSPDGRHLAVAVRGQTAQPDPDVPVEGSFQQRRLRLALIDLQTRAVRRLCANCDLLPHLLSWSADGSELLYFARADGESWTQGSLFRLAASNSEPPKAAAPELEMEVREIGVNLALSAEWIGVTPIVRARARGSREAYRWYRITTAGPVPLEAEPADQLVGLGPGTELWLSEGRLVRHGRRSATLLEHAPVTAAGLYVADLFEVGGRALFNPSHSGPAPIRFSRSGAAMLGYLEPARGAVRWTVPLPSPAARVFAIARRGAAISLVTDEHGAGTLVLSRPGRPDFELERINRHLADVDPVRRIAIEAAGADGQMLTHWLTLPPGSGPGTPLIVIPYPGLVRHNGTPPPVDFSNYTPIVGPALLTGAGFAVLEPSVPMPADTTSETISSAAAGATFNLHSRPTDGDPGDPIARTIEAAIDAVERSGRASGSDVAVYGHSFGGWAAVELAEHSDRLRAVIAAAGPYDYFAPYGFIPPSVDNRELGISSALAFSLFESGAGNVGGPPWRVPARYLERSPLYAADRITAPLMLIHGNLDFMPDASAGRLLMAMHRLGRDAVLLRYGGESHLLNSPANIRDQWTRMRTFLNRYLVPESDVQRPQ